MRAKALGFILSGCIMLSACSQMNLGSSSNEPQANQGQQGQANQGAEPTAMDYYYDFDDILVPKEMTLVTPESFIIETPQSKSGVMVFTGRVELSSLANFFINNMTKDNWVMRSAFKSGRTILIFDKDDRYCVINVTDGKLKTQLEIWVTPRVASSSAAPTTSTFKSGPKKTNPGAGVRERGLTP